MVSIQIPPKCTTDVKLFCFTKDKVTILLKKYNKKHKICLISCFYLVLLLINYYVLIRKY